MSHLQSPLTALRQNPFVLAPMAGITDNAFRSFMKKRGASVVITELVSVHGIHYASDKTIRLMRFTKEQHPIGIQLFGEDPEMIAKAAKFSQDLGCDFIDLNFGCPVPKVVKKGAGSGMLRDLPRLTEVLRATVAAVQIPVTIKVRTGWDAESLNADEVAHIAHEEGILWMAIHGRTRAQGYSGLADWDYIKSVKAKAKIPILGNGDLTSAAKSVRYLQESGCDGVLIGRGALKNPAIFTESLALWQKSHGLGDGRTAPPLSGAGMSGIYQDLKAEILAHCEEHLHEIQLKKFAAWFATGYSGASAFRKSVFQAKALPEILDLADAFFAAKQNETQLDTSQEDFLMGGHG